MAKSFQQIVDIANGSIALLGKYRLIAAANGDASALGYDTSEMKLFTDDELAKQFANELESLANGWQ